LTSINMATYIEELTNYLRESFLTDNIRFKLELQPLEFDIAEAIPIGLIVNEAVTNSIKYAFPQNRKGTITILLEKNQHLDYKLIIKDDGIGIDCPKKKVAKSSLGITLIEGLTAQLQGSCSIQNNNGTEITITFYKSEFIANEEFSRQ
jgi:two-component sensor histidine kinase